LTVQPLDETRARIEQHWGTLADSLRDVLPRAKNLSFTSASAVREFKGVLIASNTFRASRQRGGDMPVVPLVVGIDDSPRYCVGYAEEWEDRSGARPLRFKAANLTFFTTASADERPIQLFRAEWPGVREWTREAVGFQSPGAAHPHWQFDALEHYLSEEQRRLRVRRALDVLERPSEDAEEFGPAVLDTAAELVAQDEAVDISWAAVHFAAGARWPERPWDGSHDVTAPHVSSPSGLANIRNWVLSTVLYVREELLKACSSCRI
jgi:hypothetical protein